ncbi:hypothetical protein KY339_00395 [Candidatus Woesearchaeota archaeon]|nr:hypothetical protein [Candidatus Woesearchaeota archaeon]
MEEKQSELEELLYELSVVNSGLILARNRIQNGKRLPGFMFKTLMNLSWEYINAAQNFPSLRNEAEILRSNYIDFVDSKAEGTPERKKPTLYELEFEHHVVEGSLTLAMRRIQREQKLTDDMYKTVMVLAYAYMYTARKYFPEEFKEEIKVIRWNAREFRSMYNSIKKQ